MIGHWGRTVPGLAENWQSKVLANVYTWKDLHPTNVAIMIGTFIESLAKTVEKKCLIPPITQNSFSLCSEKFCQTDLNCVWTKSTYKQPFTICLRT